MFEKKISLKTGLLVLSFVSILLAAFGLMSYKVLAYNQYNLSSRIETEVPEILAAINKDPQDARARVQLGLLYMERSQWDKALEQLLIAEKLGAVLPELSYKIGFTYGQLAEWELAEKYFLLAIDQNPRYGAAYFSIGQIYKNNGDYDRALRYYRKAAEVDPRPEYNSAVNSISRIPGESADKTE